MFDVDKIPYVQPNAFKSKSIEQGIVEYLGVKSSGKEDEMEIDLFQGAYMKFEEYSLFAHRGPVEEHQDGVGYTYGMVLYTTGEHYLCVEEKRLKLETGTFFILDSDLPHKTECADNEDLIIFITKDFFHEGNSVALNSSAIRQKYKANIPDQDPNEFISETVKKLEDRLDTKKYGDFDVRPVRKVMQELEDIRTQASFYCQPVRVTKLISQTLTLLLELRVPRVPESDQELAEMLRKAEIEETITHEEFKRQSAEHYKDFGKKHREFLKANREENWSDALDMLMPGNGLLNWNGIDAEMICVEGSINAEIRRVDRGEEMNAYVEGHGTCTALAMMSAIINAHIEWHDIWKRM